MQTSKLNDKSYFYKYNNINREYTYKEMHKTIILNCGNPILYPLLEFINHILELNFRANQNEQKNYFIGWEKKYLTQHEDLKNFILKNHAIKAKNKMISIISENY